MVVNLVLLVVGLAGFARRYCNRKLHWGPQRASWQDPTDHNSLEAGKGRAWVAHVVVD